MRRIAVLFTVLSLLLLVSIFTDYLLDESLSSTSISEQYHVGNRDLNKLNSPSFDSLLTYMRSSHKIRKLEIKLPPKSMYALEAQRQKTLNTGARPVLVDPVTVKGTINSGTFSVKAKFRLKGELADHWDRSVRTSLAIDLNEGLPGIDMQKFSIMKLHSRQFPADAIYSRIKANLGLINRKLMPVRVSVNGKDWGVMLAEEHWGDDFFINHKMPEGPIIKFGDHVNGLPYRYQSVHSNVSGANKQLGSMLAQRYFYQPSSIKFATQRWADELALSELFDSFHPLLFSNLRLYFNPIDERMYPITSDQDRPIEHISFEESQNRYYKTGFEALGFLGRLRSNSNFNEQLAYSRAKLRADIYSYCSAAASDIAAEYPIDDLRKWGLGYCEKLHENAEKFSSDGRYPLDWILEKMDINQTAKSSLFAVRTDNGILVSNGFSESFLVSSIILGGEEMHLSTVIEANSEYLIKTTTDPHSLCDWPVRIEGTLLPDSDLSFETSIACSTFHYTDQKQAQEQDNLHVDGNITISDDIRVKKLTLSPNSTLVVADGVKIVVNGSMHTAQSDEEPSTIIFEGGNSSIDVKMSKHPMSTSTIKNLTVSTMGRLDENSGTALLRFFGGYVDIDGLSMDCAGYEDCLNIVDSRFNLRSSNFANCSSDCIDIDYSDGNMLNLTVMNAKGDGIDFSNAEVKMADIIVEDVFDKGLSVGEKSSIFVDGLVVVNASACIAAKDGSFLEIDNFRLTACNAFSLAGYVKKRYFTTPTVNIGNGVFDGPVAIQKTDIVKFMGSAFESYPDMVLLTSKQIDDYYQSGFMRKNR